MFNHGWDLESKQSWSVTHSSLSCSVCQMLIWWTWNYKVGRTYSLFGRGVYQEEVLCDSQATLLHRMVARNTNMSRCHICCITQQWVSGKTVGFSSSTLHSVVEAPSAKYLLLSLVITGCMRNVFIETLSKPFWFDLYCYLHFIYSFSVILLWTLRATFQFIIYPDQFIYQVYRVPINASVIGLLTVIVPDLFSLKKMKQLTGSLFFFCSHSSAPGASLTPSCLSNQQLSSPPRNTFHAKTQSGTCLNELANCRFFCNCLTASVFSCLVSSGFVVYRPVMPKLTF